MKANVDYVFEERRYYERKRHRGGIENDREADGEIIWEDAKNTFGMDF